MAGLYNRVKVTTATTGTGTVTLGSAAANNYCTFAEAGVPNSKQVRYVIEEGTDFEIGLGTYTSSGTTLSRDSVTLSKISGTAGTTKMTLAGAATVRIDAAAEDLNNGGIVTGQIPGTATNDDAVAGNIREYKVSQVLAASSISLTSGTPANIASISLTAGDWDASAMAYLNPAGTTNTTFFEASLSTTSATRNNVSGYFQQLGNLGATSGNYLPSICIRPVRFSLSSTTTVYLVADAIFTVSTNSVFGEIRARRV